MMLPLLHAAAFLTRLPVRTKQGTPQTLGRSVLYFPLVGAGIGGALAMASALVDGAPAPLAAALVLVAWVAITGGLHLDGLADTVDAWAGGGRDRQRTLDIMKDPRSGPAGVTALVLVLLVKFAALTALAGAAPLLLVLAPILGRTSMLALLFALPYVRPGGLGASHAAHLPRNPALGVLLGACALVPAAWGRIGLFALIAGSVATFWLALGFRRRIGGITGDTLGASCELVETAALAAAVLLLDRGFPP